MLGEEKTGACVVEETGKREAEEKEEGGVWIPARRQTASRVRGEGRGTTYLERTTCTPRVGIKGTV